jgi:hypothetical protein
VIEPVAERLPGDADGEIAHVGEIGQSEPAWLVLLPEDHVALRAIHRPPGADAALQSSTDARKKARMAAPHLLEDRDGAQGRSGGKHRHDLGIPDVGQWIGAAALARRLLLRRQPRIGLDPITGRGREPGLGGCRGRGAGGHRTHEKPHLVVVDVEAGQAWIPRLREEPNP